jgi:predicted dithiol-disulfide oxidoreductase (DUF899 family)
MEKPKVFSAEDWQQAQYELLQAEKRATRAEDSLAARRRRLEVLSHPAHCTCSAPTAPTR